MTLSIMGIHAFKYTAVSTGGRVVLTRAHQLFAVCLSLALCLHKTEMQEASHPTLYFHQVRLRQKGSITEETAEWRQRFCSI